MTKQISQIDLDRLVEVYKKGVETWDKGNEFLYWCAYYEGAIKRACESLGVEAPFTYVRVTKVLENSFQSGYDNFWDLGPQ